MGKKRDRILKYLRDPERMTCGDEDAAKYIEELAVKITRLSSEGKIMSAAIDQAIVSLASESSRQAIIELLRASVSGRQG